MTDYRHMITAERRRAPLSRLRRVRDGGLAARVTVTPAARLRADADVPRLAAKPTAADLRLRLISGGVAAYR